MKTEYQAIIIYRSGKRMYSEGIRSFKTESDARKSLRKTFINHMSLMEKCGDMVIKFERTHKEEPYDLVGWEIRRRQVTEWETLQLEEEI